MNARFTFDREEQRAAVRAFIQRCAERRDDLPAVLRWHIDNPTILPLFREAMAVSNKTRSREGTARSIDDNTTEGRWA